jgi:tetratricopeptide (TPR) repeat protein
MQSGQPDEAARYFHLAAQMPTDYVFPFRLEEVKVLEAAMQANPGDARAPYYLGNLLYDRQPDVAIKEWEKSAAIDSSFSLVHRNLAQGYEQSQNDTPKAIASMERAVALDPDNARLRFELDMLYEAGNVSPQKRLASFESNPALAAKRSDAMTQEAKVYLLVGRYEQALQLLKTHRFHNWEGYGDVHDVYVDACLLAGERELHAGKFNEALGDFQAALDYPENLEVGRPYHEGRRAEVDYWLGVAYGKLGNSAESLEMFRQAVAALGPQQGREQPEMLYYAGLAAQKLGRSAEATRFFGELIGKGDEALATRPEADYFAKFGQRLSSRLRLAEAHYLIGLGNLGMGEAAKARGEFQAALNLNVNHLGATTRLSPESSRTVATR